MSRTLTILGLVIALGLAALWASGGLAGLERAIVEGQREAQTVLAQAVRQIRTGAPGAWSALLAVCFGYGVLHAAGPGHGKLLIGGYGMGRRVPVARLAGLALASSLAQSAVAVALVYAGVAVLGWTRDAARGAADRWLAPVGTLAIAGVGLWLFWRGLRGVLLQSRAGAGSAHEGHGDHDHGHHDHGHHGHAHGHHQPHPHHDGAVCDHCGHAHGPTLAEAEAVTGWRDAALLIGGIALRPCTGALFLLILTWQMGIGAAGVAGAFTMGLGTACVTGGVALLAVWVREGTLASLPGAGMARALPWIEALAGALVAFAALSLWGRPL